MAPVLPLAVGAASRPDLDDGDRAMLRECPFTADNKGGRRGLSARDLARLKRIKKLWSAGYIHGQVINDGLTLRITLRNKGRVAIGRAPVPDEAPNNA